MSRFGILLFVFFACVTSKHNGDQDIQSRTTSTETISSRPRDSRTSSHTVSQALSSTPSPPRPHVASDHRQSITLTYLGAAGWQIQHDETTILLDPYFTRPANLNGTISPDTSAIATHSPKAASLILVGHSHVDHLLDVPSIALRTGAQIIGSPSTARVAHASKVPSSQMITVKGGEDFQM